MNKDSNKIKKDLYDIYSYFKHISDSDFTQNIFTKSFLDKTKHSLDDILEALGLNDTKTNMSAVNKDKIKKEISKITDISLLRDFYYINLAQLFYGDADEFYVNKVINSIPRSELMRLYGIISTIPIKRNKSRKDILQMLKNYFDDESRTNDINKKLSY
ncbi:MAG: hypothetical protein AB6733_23350 [Clostridiaceae bacterium]